MGKMKEYWAEREKEWNLMEFEHWYSTQNNKQGGRKWRKKSQETKKSKQK